MKYNSKEYKYLDCSDWHLIKRFLDEVGYNKTISETINLFEGTTHKEEFHTFTWNDYSETLDRFNKRKYEHLLEIESQETKIKHEKYLKILEDEDLIKI